MIFCSYVDWMSSLFSHQCKLVRLTYREKMSLPINRRRPRRLHTSLPVRNSRFAIFRKYRRVNCCKSSRGNLIFITFIKHDNARAPLSEITHWTDPKHSHKCIVSYRAGCVFYHNKACAWYRAGKIYSDSCKKVIMLDVSAHFKRNLRRSSRFLGRTSGEENYLTSNR